MKETTERLKIMLVLCLLTALSVWAAPSQAEVLQARNSGELSGFSMPGRFPVQSKSITLEDKERKKSLEMVITYPRAKGSFPLIVFSHGAFGKSGLYSPLVNHWVSHGYICIQPTHEDSLEMYGKAAIRDSIRKQGGIGGGRDPRQAFSQAFARWQMLSFANWASRPLDIKFIMDNIDRIESLTAYYPCRIDKRLIGVGGHSFGAHTSQIIGGTIIGGSQEYSDPRPRAILLLSPQGIESGRNSSLSRESWKRFSKPMMVITGTEDTGRNKQSYQWRMDPFKYSSGPHKYLLVIEGADHDFGGITERSFKNRKKDKTQVSWVKSASLAYFDSYLKGDRKAYSYLRNKDLETESNKQVNLSIK